MATFKLAIREKLDYGSQCRDSSSDAVCMPVRSFLGDLWAILERLIGILEKPQEEEEPLSSPLPEMHSELRSCERQRTRCLHCFFGFSVGTIVSHTRFRMFFYGAFFKCNKAQTA